MIVSSSGSSLRWASMNASSSGVMSSLRKMGWYCGSQASFLTRSRISFAFMCKPWAIKPASAERSREESRSSNAVNDG